LVLSCHGPDFYGMDFGDEFNNYVVNELIDSSSSNDDNNFYFDAVNIAAEASQHEPIHRGSIVEHFVLWIVNDFCSTTCFIMIILQRTQYLILICLGGG
jgi:hypothetical protein